MLYWRSADVQPSRVQQNRTSRRQSRRVTAYGEQSQSQRVQVRQPERQGTRGRLRNRSQHGGVGREVK